MNTVFHGTGEGAPALQCSTAVLARRALGGCRTDGASADWRLTGQLPLQSLAERHEVGAECEADITQLDHINAAYAALDVAHKVLDSAEFRCEVLLPHTASETRCPEQLAQPFIFDAVNGLAHGRRQWERPWTLYCMIVYTKIVYLARVMLGVLRARVKGGREGDRGGSPHGASAPKSRGTHRRDQWSAGAELGRAAVGSCLWKEGAYGRL